MITPRTHAKYRDNAERATVAAPPCAVCGKPVVVAVTTRWARVVDGGARFAPRDEVVEEAGDMGCWPVGRGCLRKHPDLAAITFTMEEEE